MDATEQVTVQFRVVSGADLPRTNFIGSIDPYLRVQFDGQLLGETRHFKNQQQPVWEEDFFFDAIRDADGYLAGIVRLDLYDENKARQDELVGTVDIDLSEIPPEAADPRGQQQIAFYDYPVSYKNDKRGEKLAKQGREPQVTIAFLGAIPSWSSLAAQLDGWEEELGLIADEDSRQLYVPLPGGEGAGLYGGIQYILPRAVHFKLVTVSKQHAGLHLDFKCSKSRCLRVERVTYHRHRRRLVKGLRVYGEATLTNLPLSTDMHKLQLVATARRAVSSLSVAETLEAAGFPANVFGTALSYKRVAKDMAAAASLDEPCGSVFVPAGNAPHGALVQLDFCEGAMGQSKLLTSMVGGPAPRLALRAMTLKGQAEVQGKALVHDFATAGCETTTTYSESHRKPIKVLGGEYEVVRTSELPGAFCEDNPELYDNAKLVGYALEAHPITSCRFSELFEPPVEEEEPAEDDRGGVFDVFDPDGMPHSMGSMAVMVATHGGKMVGKMVDQLGTTAAGNAVLNAFKAPLKLFRGAKNRGGDDNEECSNSDRVSERNNSGSIEQGRNPSNKERANGGGKQRSDSGKGHGRLKGRDDEDVDEDDEDDI